MSHEAIAYLNEALDLLEQYSVKHTTISWEQFRNDLLPLADQVQSIPEIYPIIQMALARLGDHHSFFVPPNAVSHFEEGSFHNIGLLAVYPEGTIVHVYKGSPAEHAGLHTGDVLETINHAELAVLGSEVFKDALNASPTVMLTLKRAGHRRTHAVMLEAATYPLVAEPLGRLLAQGIGYLDLPGIVGNDQMLSAYAAMLHQLIGQLDQSPLHGWVVDLRRDTGGNMFPMLIGVGPLLGEGELGAFVDHAGSRMPWVYRDGQLSIGEWAGRKYNTAYRLKRRPPAIAVLTSRLTASSGELVVLAFCGRAHVRIFGEETAGLPTANEGMQLSDGAMLHLTVALGADCSGRTYDGPLVPDEYVAADWRQFGTESDPVLVAATSWIRDGNLVGLR